MAIQRTPRPKVTQSDTHKIVTGDGCQTLYITVGKVDGKVIEVFITMGKSGECNTCHCAALGIAISNGLQHGVPLSVYTDSLRGIRCPNPMICVASKDDRILSCPDAVAKVLSLYLDDVNSGT